MPVTQTATVMEVVQKALDAVNRHDPDAFAALYSADAIALDPQYAEPLDGRQAIRKDIADFFTAFPDLNVRLVGPIVVDGDTAGFEVEMTGTHAGPLVSPAGSSPPTNRRVSMRGGRFVRLNDHELITECRRYYDMAGIMQQLGLM